MNVQVINAQSCLQHQKFRYFNKCFSTWKQNGILAQNLLFLKAEIFLSNAYFSNSITLFLARIQFSRPADGGKKDRAFFSLLKKDRVHFRLKKKKKRQGTVSSEKHKTWTLSNFVKILFSWKWILWRIHFSHIEFCDESIFLMLKFVKCPKMVSISPK